MTVEAVPYSGEGSDEWNDFVVKSNNGTLFHRLDFLDYHPDDKFEEHNLMFYYKGQNLLGVMPLAIDEEEGRRVARSPYGGSYGGIVVEDDIPFRRVDDMVEALVDYLEEKSVDEAIVRNAPREQNPVPSSYTEFHYSHKGFEIEDREVTNVVDLDRFEEDPFEIYEGRCRTAVRNAREELETTHNSEDWDSFYDILTETYDRHGKEPTHTREELEELSDRFPDRVRMALAYHEGEPAAGILQFVIDERVNSHFYNCRKEEHRGKNGVNLLLDEEIRRSKTQGFRYLDLGTSVENYEWNDGLVKFKESFGATGHLRNVYRLDL